MAWLLILLLLATLIFAFRRRIARLLERAQGPIARMRGNHREVQPPQYQAPYYNTAHVQPNPNYYNAGIPTTYNYPPQPYANPQYIPNPVYQANPVQIGRTDASVARIGPLASNPYEVHNPSTDSVLGSGSGVNPYIR